MNNENILYDYLTDLQVITEQPRTAANIVSFLYKEGVAGLNPASPTKDTCK
jgi:hypothetical protein